MSEERVTTLRWKRSGKLFCMGKDGLRHRLCDARFTSRQSNSPDVDSWKRSSPNAEWSRAGSSPRDTDEVSASVRLSSSPVNKCLSATLWRTRLRSARVHRTSIRAAPLTTTSMSWNNEGKPKSVESMRKGVMRPGFRSGSRSSPRLRARAASGRQARQKLSRPPDIVDAKNRGPRGSHPFRAG
jgi:hypothetical protein